MLLDATLDQQSTFRDSAMDRVDWQDNLADQASAHPLFRRRQIALLGGRGHVVLTGTVSSYYEKQLAQEFVRRCDGVRQIDNRIDVAYG